MEVTRAKSVTEAVQQAIAELIRKKLDELKAQFRKDPHRRQLAGGRGGRTEEGIPDGGLSDDHGPGVPARPVRSSPAPCRPKSR
jgi:hypothetical protein